ncbi:OmpH family outer membrane protein [Megasphaera hominis]|jgi:outer membrane protein|uniref:OmpH family outer membrane protein n=1 Tax=Megasphaera hominis TaxID=159836 RepID=A0ABR6VGX7_9FIRM|nr:OmpH family outer membrane protein [Megasphaera hominis]MBC3535884.1 OmpH family outer membrane protein [Megasphaera hominis]
MKRLGKRFAAVVCMILAIGALSGCGSEDKVGYVDMARVQKEAPMVQQYQKKMEDKDKALNDELQKDKQSMSAEDFQKKQQQAQQERQIYAASMQQQFLSEIQTKLADIAKDKNVGIVVYKEVVPSGGIDVTDDLIAKLQ